MLLHYKGQDIAVLEVTSKYRPNKAKEAKLCYGTSSLEHPGVQMIAQERGAYYLGGRVHGLELPKREYTARSPAQARPDPCRLRRPPPPQSATARARAARAQVRAALPANVDVVAFQCRNPIHRAHYELFTRALHAPNVGKDGIVLVHPTMGPTQDDDIPGLARPCARACAREARAPRAPFAALLRLAAAQIRLRTYEVLKEETRNPRVEWAYLPYSMHMAGPREAIQHMLIRKNYGCTHFIIGRDMAGSKSSLSGEDFYGAYDAQDLAKANAAELGMDTARPARSRPRGIARPSERAGGRGARAQVPSLNVVFTEEEGYVTADVAKEKKLKELKLSGTKFRQMLRAGEPIPEWFAFKSVVAVLREEAAKAAK